LWGGHPVFAMPQIAEAALRAFNGILIPNSSAI
jgi:hypothetical protein